MKTVALPDVRSDPATYLEASELERRIARVLGHRLSRFLDSRGVSEEDVQRDFDALRLSKQGG